MIQTSSKKKKKENTETKRTTPKKSKTIYAPQRTVHNAISTILVLLSQ